MECDPNREKTYFVGNATLIGVEKTFHNLPDAMTYMADLMRADAMLQTVDAENGGEHKS